MIDHFTKDEAQMNEEISSREYKEGFNNVEERTYKVDATGATISSVSSISLLHRYCSKLPHDEYDVIFLLFRICCPLIVSVLRNSIILFFLKLFNDITL